MALLFNLIIFVLVLSVIVFIHELGHFIFAKLFNVYVYEFAIGMGPKLFSIKGKNKETTYSIRLIPIGGFVQLAGEEVEDDDEKVLEDRKLYNKPIWQRFLIMFFGAGFNFILAFILILSIGLFNGAPNTKPIITNINNEYNAYLSGIRENDLIVKINGNKVYSLDDLALYLEVINKEKEIDIVVKRDNEYKNYKFLLNKEKKDNKDVYRLGVTFESKIRKDFFSIIDYTFTKISSLFRQMIFTLKSLFTGLVSVKQLSGPVGIFSVVEQTSKAGFINIVFLTALLSLNVGFINLLPIPAFDGGRILFLIIEKIKGSKIKPETENKIHLIGFIFLMILMLLITFNDIIKLF